MGNFHSFQLMFIRKGIHFPSRGKDKQVGSRRNDSGCKVFFAKDSNALLMFLASHHGKMYVKDNVVIDGES